MYWPGTPVSLPCVGGVNVNKNTLPGYEGVESSYSQRIPLDYLQLLAFLHQSPNLSAQTSAQA